MKNILPILKTNTSVFPQKKTFGQTNMPKWTSQANYTKTIAFTRKEYVWEHHAHFEDLSIDIFESDFLEKKCCPKEVKLEVESNYGGACFRLCEFLLVL